MSGSRARLRDAKAAQVVAESPVRAHGDGARRAGKPVGDATLYVRLPKEDLRWLKIYAAQEGRTLTDLAQEWVRTLRQSATRER
jgi:hypothetical protein